MYSVIDFSSTITVIRNANTFLLTNLASGEVISLKSSEFFGNSFKYEIEFLMKFKNSFKDTKIKNVLFSYEASEYISEILFFNRVDN